MKRRRRKEAGQLESLVEEVGRDLRVAQQLLRRPLESEFARGRLTGPQRLLMQVVVRTGPVSLKALGRTVGLAHSTVSGIVDRLEARGLLRREVDAKDRRVSRIGVTPVVHQFLERKLPELARHPMATALAAGTSRERRDVHRGISTLRRLLERSSERDPAETRLRRLP